ncbi:MAG: hypothetical protein HWN65_06235 [Candidatus Helarchaeota archaeon]|nr:hypothetical protein [Candidatus Helarchaeota archaeon]
MAVEKKKRRKIFKCPICKDTIQFIIQAPDNVERYPFMVEYEHGDHVLQIYFDMDLMIREIRHE